MAEKKTKKNTLGSETEPSENGTSEISENLGEISTDIPAEKPKKRKPRPDDKYIIHDSETAREMGRRGGQRSGQVRRENAERRKDARDAVRYLLNLAAKGTLKNNLKELGYPDDECTNMAALQARMFTLVMQKGDQDAYLTLMRMAGYDPEEIRKERESLNADERRNKEVAAKIEALGQRGPDASVSLAFDDEDDHDDVVVYMPQMATEDSCQMPPENEDGDKSDEE